MDRSDEKRDNRAGERPDETYNPLGIGNANPPRDRVQRDVEGAEVEGADVDDTGGRTRAGTREIQRSPGATSIDMGAGGTGTEIERD